VKEISLELERNRGAISYRIKKLGIFIKRKRTLASTVEFWD